MQAFLREQLLRKKGRYTDRMPGGRPPTKPQPAFGQRLAALRKERGLSQPQVAKMLGTSREVVSYYERRATNPTTEFLAKVSVALDVSISDLLGKADAKPRRKPGPASQLEARFDEVRKLPKARQKFVIDFLDTVLRDSSAEVNGSS